MIAIVQNIHHHKIRFLTQACLLNTFLFVNVPCILYLYLSEEVLYAKILKVSKENQHYYSVKMAVKSQKKVLSCFDSCFYHLNVLILNC